MSTKKLKKIILQENQLLKNHENIKFYTCISIHISIFFGS